MTLCHYSILWDSCNNMILKFKKIFLRSGSNFWWLNHMQVKPERELNVFDDSLDLSAFLLLLWLLVLFENETWSVTVSSFLSPQRQQSLLHITRYSCRSCIFTVCVCEVFDSASTRTRQLPCASRSHVKNFTKS